MRTGTNRGPDYGGSGDDGTGTTIGADLVDFRLGRFHGDVVGVQNHFHQAPGTLALRAPAACAGVRGPRP
ncbi:hypothetical protein JCM4814A_78420 [Streptomyces phaeofaciens JCM 4814]|uniref:Uncharacterized protein n=1 Tax=Streptomyces phaeofaciens TaxID=68254 RepID=A0A918HR54_9ACTN|nr:hypothetical protein [Streptomyces phaeofaciens]GGT98820.1 hypothetical protein GCM10010226_90050 [Streptomyces phaeofaciens]